MYALNFYSPLFIDQLRRGRKTATIRLGDKRAKYDRFGMSGVGGVGGAMSVDRVMQLRAQILDAYDMSLGMGLGRLTGKIFRIGHLGDFNDLTLAGTLSGVEMGLALAGVPHKKGGVGAALEYLTDCAKQSSRKAA